MDVKSLFEATRQSFYGQGQKPQPASVNTSESATSLIESINMVR